MANRSCGIYVMIVMSDNFSRLLKARVQGVDVLFPPKMLCHEEGDVLDLCVTGVWPEVESRIKARIELSAGGGFAGQVYRCVIEDIDESSGKIEGLERGGVYRIKILLPPKAGRLRFRNFIYWLAFQGPFSAQVNRNAVRAGAIWQKIIQRGIRCELGRDDAVSEIYCTFYDSDLGAYGQVSEWVEGRTWRMEPDTHPELRQNWCNVDPASTESPEYIAKRQFMAKFVQVMHDMGGHEFARQYEWWTMKSQPNVLKRHGAGEGPGDGLCAIDFRSGLALLPYLPMSVGDVRLILAGLCRGSFAQFDRCVYRDLRRFISEREADFSDMSDAVQAFEKYDMAYRRSLPDLSHHGWMLILDSELASDVRNGLIEGYLANRLVGDEFAVRLRESKWLFARFYMLGAIPFLGRFMRRMWGNPAYKQHILCTCTDSDYFTKSEKAAVALRLWYWLRAGRIGENRARLLLSHPALFWMERCTVGLVFDFFPCLHRVVMEPFYLFGRMAAGCRFMRSFYMDADVREKWLTDQINEGYKDGMLDDDEKEHILGHVKDPFIVKYLKSVAVHFATLPVTQIVSFTVAWFVCRWMLLNGASEAAASGAFVGIIVLFQLTPISPGSLCRGFYVVYRMVREKNSRDYMIAAPISFLKYMGYLAFPIQMVAAYPALARFMASRWATGAVRIVPVFGEKGALLEHMVFNQCFNKTQIFFKWASERVVLLLNAWMLLGFALMLLTLYGCDLSFTDKDTMRNAVNVALGFIVLFVLPRVLFFPVLSRKRKAQATE